jgi:hypothetical protein
MPVQYDTIQIPLVRGVDEKSDTKVAQPPSLLQAINVEVDKTGKIQKRRGFMRVDTNDEVFNSGDTERVFHHITTYDGELVMFGYDYLYADVSKDASVQTSKSTVLRGRLIRSTVDVIDVAGSGGGDLSGAPS